MVIRKSQNILFAHLLKKGTFVYSKQAKEWNKK